LRLRFDHGPRVTSAVGRNATARAQATGPLPVPVAPAPGPPLAGPGRAQWLRRRTGSATVARGGDGRRGPLAAPATVTVSESGSHSGVRVRLGLTLGPGPGLGTAPPPARSGPPRPGGGRADRRRDLGTIMVHSVLQPKAAMLAQRPAVGGCVPGNKSAGSPWALGSARAASTSCAIRSGTSRAPTRKQTLGLLECSPALCNTHTAPRAVAAAACGRLRRCPPANRALGPDRLCRAGKDTRTTTAQLRSRASAVCAPQERRGCTEPQRTRGAQTQRARLDTERRRESPSNTGGPSRRGCLRFECHHPGPLRHSTCEGKEQMQRTSSSRTQEDARLTYRASDRGARRSICKRHRGL
jgi:hypothetical protein